MGRPNIKMFTAVALIAIAGSVGAQINTDAGVAIQGYDPVAYFQAGEPQRGSMEHATEWGGATWYFASAENLELFESDPERYAPQFGGYCAWAAAQGYVAGIDPRAWTIHEGMLYLNFSQGVKRRFERDLSGHIASAERNWPGLAAGL